MIKKYNVNVNGKTYQVEVEEVRDGAASPQVTRPAAPVHAAPPVVKATPNPNPNPAPAPAPTPAPAPASKPAAGAQVVAAPMPGTIISIKVKAGDAVKKGSVLLILEAMKMENEIMAPSDGTVAGVHAAAGASVNTGDPLISLS